MQAALHQASWALASSVNSAAEPRRQCSLTTVALSSTKVFQRVQTNSSHFEQSYSALEAQNFQARCPVPLSAQFVINVHSQLERTGHGTCWQTRSRTSFQHFSKEGRHFVHVLLHLQTLFCTATCASEAAVRQQKLVAATAEGNVQRAMAQAIPFTESQHSAAGTHSKTSSATECHAKWR